MSQAAEAPPANPIPDPAPVVQPPESTPPVKPADNAAAIRQAALESSPFLKAALGPSRQPVKKPDEKVEKDSAVKPDEKPPEEKEARPAKKVPAPRDPIAEAVAAGAAAGTAAAERIAATMKPAAGPAEELPLSESVEDLLPERLASRAGEVLELVQGKPAQYGGLVKHLKDAVTAHSAYARKWEKANPGQKFDPEDGEHDVFFEEWGLEVKYPELDADLAKQAQARANQVQQDRDTRLARLEQAEQERLVGPLIQAAHSEIVKSAIEALGDEYTEALKAGPEAMKAKLTDDPLAGATFKAAMEFAARAPWNPSASQSVPWAELVSEVVRFHATGRLGNPDSPATQSLIGLADRMDSELAAMPKDETVAADGRRFATRGQYLQMNAAERERHWAIGQAEMLDYARRHIRAFVQAHDEQLKGLVEKAAPKLGYKHETKQMGKTTPEPAKPSAPQPVITSKPAVTTPGVPIKSNNQPRNAFLEAIGVKV